MSGLPSHLYPTRLLPRIAAAILPIPLYTCNKFIDYVKRFIYFNQTVSRSFHGGPRRSGRIRPSGVHISKRPPLANQHWKKDILWTDIRPSGVHISNRPQHWKRDSLWTAICLSGCTWAKRTLHPFDIGKETAYGQRWGSYHQKDS